MLENMEIAWEACLCLIEGKHRGQSPTVESVSVSHEEYKRIMHESFKLGWIAAEACYGMNPPASEPVAEAK